MNAPTSSFPNPNPVNPPRSVLVHILYVVLLLLAFAAVSQLGAATLYWDTDAATTTATGGTGNWETSSSLWRTGSSTGTLGTWPTTGADNDANLSGTAGTLTLTTGISVNDISVAPSPSGIYIITGATQTLTLNGTAQSVLDVASGSTLAITSGLAGTNGFTKSSTGTLILDSAAGTARLLGSITVNGGTLQAGSTTNNGASQVLRSNAVNLAVGTNVTTVGTTIDLRVGSLSGSGSVTPATGGAVNVHALADATFSGAITTTGGLNLRGGNGTTQTFNGNLTGLTGTIGINSGATIKLSGTGDSTSGVLGTTATLALRGGTLALDNTAGNTGAAGGRFGDAAAVSTTGGTLSLVGNSAGTTETVGAVTFNDGANTVSVTNNGGTGAQLTFTDTGSLRDSTKMTVNFVGVGTGTLGSSGNNPRITFTGTPFTGTVTGLLSNTTGSDTTIGWATANTTEWAGYGANGIVAVAPTLTTATNTGLQGGTATSVTLFNPSANQTLGAAATTGTLKLAPTTTGLSLALGANNLSTNAVMLAGTTDFTVSGTGQFANSGSGTRYIWVTDANTTLSVSAPISSASPINKSGAGFLALTGASSQIAFAANQNINLLQGVLRGTGTSLGGATSAGGAFSTINLRGGVVEISGGGTFNRAFNLAGASGGGGINWDGGSGTTRGDGGFSAIGGAASVTLMTTVGGATAASLVWNAAGFVNNGYALTMGSTKADSAITFTNAIGLDDGTATNNYFAREIRVADNTGSSGDMAVLSGIISGSANADLLKTGAGVLQLTGANTYSGNTIISAGTLQVGSGSTTGTLGSTGAILNNGILSINRSDAFTISAPIAGTGSVTKLAAGALTLSGNNSYSGGTTLNGGQIALGHISGLGTGALTVGTGAQSGTSNGTSAFLNTVALTGAISVANDIILPNDLSATNRQIHNKGGSGNSLQLTGTISGGGTGTVLFLTDDTADSAGIIRLSGTNTFTGSVTLNRGSVQIDSDAALGATANTLTLNSYAGHSLIFTNAMTYTHNTAVGFADATFNTGSNNVIASGVISTLSGTIGIIKTGSGNLTINNTNTYNGGTTVNGGVLIASGGAAIPDVSAVTLANTAGVSLQLNNNETVASIAGGGTTGGTIELGNNTLSLAGTASTSFSGVINGIGGSITKIAASTGTLTLSGTNTYTGGTNLNGGALSISNGSALGTGTLNVNLSTGATFLTVTNTAATDVGNAIAMPAPGSAQLYVISKSAASSSTGTQLNLTGAISGGNANTTLRFTSGTTGDYTTTYRLAGNNTFSGVIELYRGAIVITNNNSLGNATLNLNGNNNTTLGDLRFENSVTLSNNIALVNNSNPDPINTNGNTATLNGIVSSTGSAGLVKIGSGTLLLGGTNTYTVTTAINEGTLKVATVAAN